MQLLVMRQTRGAHVKGDIVEIRATGTPFVGKEPDAFVIIDVPGVPMTNFRKYADAWERLIDFEVVNQDLSQDGFRLRLFSPLVDSLGAGAITKDEVEQFITSWGGQIHSFGVNEVVFDVRIFNAMKSNAFWEVNVSGAVFTELAYDQGTGIHRIQVDYSSLPNNPSYIETYVEHKGATIISHADKVLVLDIARSTVRNEFERDIQEKATKQVVRRRYYVGSGVVDYVIGQGGTVQTDLSTLQGYIRDKTAQ